MVEFIFHVRTKQSVCVCVLLIYIIDKGIAKIAKKLGFDFAEAVVRQ